MRRVHWLLFASGAACLAALVLHTGAATLWRELRSLGWGTAAIVSLASVEHLLHALAWSRCFRRRERPAWLRLLGVQLAGGAINLVTPTATLGGEIVRGSLLPTVSAPTAVAALAVDRLACAVADTGLGALGLAVLLVRADLSGWAALGVLAAAALFVTGVGVFWMLQRNGSLLSRILGHPLTRRVIGSRAGAAVGAAGREVDAGIAAFHAERSGSFRAALGLHAAGSLVGAAQLGLFFHFVGAGVGVVAALQAFLVAMALDLFSFFVPARLGAQEGARMFAVSLVGLDPALGLLFSLVLRAEQFAWATFGLALYSAFLAGSADERPLRARGAGPPARAAVATPLADATAGRDSLGGLEC